jgi:hypothetical protein
VFRGEPTRKRDAFLSEVSWRSYRIFRVDSVRRDAKSVRKSFVRKLAGQKKFVMGSEK